MAKSVNIRNTKNEILAAYKEAIKERKDFEGKVKQLEKDLAIAKKSNKEKLKTVVSQNIETQLVSSPSVPKEACPTPKQVHNLKDIINSLHCIQSGISNSIGTNSAQQLVEAETLATLREQFIAESKQIKELFDIELENQTLEQLIEEYEASKAAFNETINNRRKEIEEEMIQKELDWAKEKETTQLSIHEREQEAQKVRDRELAEHQYNMEQERMKEDDRYEVKKKALNQELVDIKEAKKVEWDAKEKVVMEQEQEFHNYKVNYEALPAKLEAGIKKAEAEGTNIIKRQARIKADLLAKEVDALQKATQLKITSLKAIIDKQEKQVQKLTDQLENALKQAQNLAIKAIEGSANSNSLEAIKLIAMEQAKHSNGKK